jgi:hypothetical protein
MSRCELSTGQLADDGVPITSGTPISFQCLYPRAAGAFTAGSFWLVSSAVTTLVANLSRARAASPRRDESPDQSG